MIYLVHVAGEALSLRDADLAVKWWALLATWISTRIALAFRTPRCWLEVISD